MNWAKALGKFLLGAVGTGVALLQTNPDLLLSRLPEGLVAMSIGGAVVEIIDFAHHKLTK